MNSILRRILCIVLLLGCSSGLYTSPLDIGASPSQKGSITIIGMVKRPGTYQIDSPLTILKALELAGGIAHATYNGGIGPPAPYAERTRVERGRTNFTVNVGKRRTQEDENFKILPGDKIIVPEVIF